MFDTNIYREQIKRYLLVIIYFIKFDFYLKQEVSFAGHKPTKAIVQALSISLNPYLKTTQLDENGRIQRLT